MARLDVHLTHQPNGTIAHQSLPQKIASVNKPPITSQPKIKDCNKFTNRNTSINTDSIPDNLIDVLPLKDDQNTAEEHKPFASHITLSVP